MPKTKNGLTQKRTKAGTSKEAAAKRREVFARAYLANGRNATEAAITAGFSRHSAHTRGLELVKDRETAALIEATHAELSAITGLDQERTLREVARLSYADPRKMFRPDGTLIPVHELDDDVAATVASIEHETETETSEDGESTTTRLAKVKVWDKNAALEKAMKFHGLYEKDNRQRGESLSIKVQLVKVG
jgi:phage terminase small subunit